MEGPKSSRLPSVRGERDAAFAFVGRQAESALLLGKAVHAINVGENRGGLVLVDGVPGIGKTQFLNVLESRLATSLGSETSVVRVAMNADVIPDSEQVIFERLTEKISGRHSRGAFGRLQSVTSPFGGVSFHPPDQPQSPANVHEALRRSVRQGWWDKKILLLTIDEVQNAKEQAGLLLALLQGGVEGVPMLTVCAGLPNSAFILSRFGISRLAEHLRLGSLSLAEAAQSFEEGLPVALHEAGLSSWTRRLQDFMSESEKRQLVNDTGGFPRHITTAIRGVVTAIAEAREAGAGTPRFVAVRAAVAAERDSYYQSRISGRFFDVEMLAPLATMLSKRVEGITQRNLNDCIAEMHSGIPSDERVDDIRDQLIRSGFVAPNVRGLFDAGIQLMNEYVLRRASELRGR